MRTGTGRIGHLLTNPDAVSSPALRFAGTRALKQGAIGDRYGRPGKGNDKGAVEGLVGWSRRNFMVPLPRFASLEALNLYLEQRCRERQGRRAARAPREASRSAWSATSRR